MALNVSSADIRPGETPERSHKHCSSWNEPAPINLHICFCTLGGKLQHIAISWDNFQTERVVSVFHHEVNNLRDHLESLIL